MQELLEIDKTFQSMQGELVISALKLMEID